MLGGKSKNNIQERFYNRHNELAVVQKTFGAEKPEMRQHIINFYGGAGSGKSWLLKKLRYDYEQRIPCFLPPETDVSSFPWISNEEFLTNLIIRLGRQIQHFLPTVPKVPEVATIENLEKYLEQLLYALKNHSTTNILFLFDDYDNWPQNLQKVFEKKFLSKIIQYECSAVALTSLSSMSFHGQPALRLQTNYHKIGTFTSEIIKRQYSQYAEVASKIFHITAGVPFCVERLVDQLGENNIINASRFRVHEATLVERNYQDYIKARILEQVDPELHETINILALLRCFNVGIMNDLLPEFISDKYHWFSNIDYLELIDNLGYLASWDSARNGFAVPKTVRQIISYYMMKLHPKIFSNVHNRMLSVYEKQITQSPPDVHDIVEYLYHRLISIQSECKAKPDIQAAFSDHVQEQFTQYTTDNVSIDYIVSLKKRLETDEDMKEYLTKETQKMIEQTLKSLK